MNQLWPLYIIIAFVLSTGMTALLMPVLLRLCKRRGIYDLPDGRKVHHHNNIPRLGGVLFIPSMLVGVAGAMLLMKMNEERMMSSVNMLTLLIVIGMFLIYLIGLLDDLFGMPATLKLAIQFVVTIFLPFCGLHIGSFYGVFGLTDMPLWLAYPITVFVSLLIVNAVNLIDGIDGLASGLSFLAILCFGLIYYHEGLIFYALYCTGLLGTVLVFFLFNMFGNATKGTKTFMGDTGSLTLGYALTFLSIRYMTAGMPHTVPCLSDSAPFLIPFTLMIVPCFDLVRVACLRIKRKVSIFFPDKTHIHHKCLRAGFTMRQALVLIVLLQAGYFVLNCGLDMTGCNINLIVGIDILVFLLFNVWLNRRIARNEKSA